MKSIHRALRLSHHKHTGKLLHHHHTSYGLLVFLMAIPVLVLVLMGQMVYATDSVKVTGVVPQEPPPFAPTITYPLAGSRIDDAPVTVKGACPLANPAVIIAIYENSVLRGSTICNNATGTYSVPISFSYGQHTLVAKVVTFTGQQGLSSAAVTFNRVYIVPTKNLGSGSTNGNVLLPGIQPLVMVTSQPVVAFGPNSDALLQVTFSGGIPPYNVSIDWGDGVTEDYRIYDQTEQVFSHVYPSYEEYLQSDAYRQLSTSQQGEKTRNYLITITVTDSDGNISVMTIIASSPIPFNAPQLADTTTRTAAWYETLIASPIIRLYAIIFVTLLLLWVIWRRRHRYDDDHKYPRHHMRRAHRV